MLTSADLKKIRSEARPLIEQQMAIATKLAGFREIVSGNGGDWAALKAIIKAEIQDEQDETGEAAKIDKVCGKAEFTLAYAETFGLNMNEENFLSDAREIAQPTEPAPRVEVEAVEDATDAPSLSTAPIQEPDERKNVAGASAAPPAGGVEFGDSAPDVKQASDTRTEIQRTVDEVQASRANFNAATHFRNSKGLARLHGCQDPDTCAGSHRELCVGCRRVVEAAA